MGVLAFANAIPENPEQEMTDWLQILIVLIGSGGVGGAVSLATIWADRRKRKAEADVVDASAAERWDKINADRWAEMQAERKSMRAELSEMRGELTQVKAENEGLRAMNARLISANEKLQQDNARLWEMVKEYQQEVDARDAEVQAHGLRPLPKLRLPEVK